MLLDCVVRRWGDGIGAAALRDHCQDGGRDSSVERDCEDGIVRMEGDHPAQPRHPRQQHMSVHTYVSSLIYRLTEHACYVT